MSNPTIASAAISALEHPISALDDRPALAADDLKAYFDADPQQLCEAHNTLVSALTAPEGASGVGFLASDTISANLLALASHVECFNPSRATEIGMPIDLRRIPSSSVPARSRRLHRLRGWQL